MERLKRVLSKSKNKSDVLYGELQGKSYTELLNAERKAENSMESDGMPCHAKYKLDKLPGNNTPTKLNSATIEPGNDTSYINGSCGKDVKLDTEINPFKDGTQGLYPKLEEIKPFKDGTQSLYPKLEEIKPFKDGTQSLYPKLEEIKPFNDGTHSLNTKSGETIISSQENVTYDEDKDKDSNVALVGINYSKGSKYAIKATAAYTDLRIEMLKNGQTRKTKMHAKAEGIVNATSEGNAKLNIDDKGAAEVKYKAKLESDGMTEFKGYENIEISNATSYEKKIAVCTGIIEGKFKGSADAEMEISKCETKLGTGVSMKGDTKANFTLAEANMSYEKGQKATLAFRLIDGKAEGKASADGNAYLGKVRIGFETGIEGEAEHCLAKGNAEITKMGIPNANLTIGKASAKGKAKFGVNANVYGKKFGSKFEVSGEVNVCELDVKNVLSGAMRPFPKLLSDVSPLVKVQVKQTK